MSTETSTAPGGISAARAACEAFWAVVEAGPAIQEPGAAWNWAKNQNTTGAWAAAAKAAVSAQASTAADGPAAKALRDADLMEAAAEILERRYPSSRPERLDDTIGELHAIARSWRRMADAHPDVHAAADGPCCTGCGPGCACGGSPHGGGGAS